VALAELVGFFDETGHAHRVAQPSWSPTSYEIVGGRAVIDEICGCGRTERPARRHRLHGHLAGRHPAGRMRMRALPA
jgi:hypothetical protein